MKSDTIRNAALTGGLLVAAFAAAAGELATDELTVYREAILQGEVVVSPATENTIVDPKNPILVLTFDQDVGGVVLDATTNGNDGVAYGGYSYIPDRNGGSALLLNGWSGYVAIPDNAQFHMSNYTLVAWIKTSNAGTLRRRIISQQYSDYWLMALNYNVLEMGSSQAGVLETRGGSLNNNTWTMVAVVRDSTGGLVRWNVDGADVGTKPITSTAPDASPGVSIVLGKVFNGQEYFAGAIDDVRVYNQALSAADLQALYTTPITYTTVTHPSSLHVTVPATITHLVPQGDIGMGEFTNEPE